MHLCALYLLMIVGTAHGQRFQRTVNVAGRGVASAPPDLATIFTGVVTMAKTAKKALADNNNHFGQVLQVLKEKGIDDKDVQTTSFGVNPQFERRSGGERGKVIGYRVSNEVQVKVRDLDILGEVLDALVTAGSNNISGISFSLDDAKEATDEARTLAVDDATNRAKLYAKAAGVKLGKVLSISESAIDQPRPGRQVPSAAAADAAPVPIATGELEVQATVFMLFELVGA